MYAFLIDVSENPVGTLFHGLHHSWNIRWEKLSTTQRMHIRKWNHFPIPQPSGFLRKFSNDMKKFELGNKVKFCRKCLGSRWHHVIEVSIDQIEPEVVLILRISIHGSIWTFCTSKLINWLFVAFRACLPLCVTFLLVPIRRFYAW